MTCCLTSVGTGDLNKGLECQSFNISINSSSVFMWRIFFDADT